MKRNIKKSIYLISAFLCLAIGGIGVVMPILPTTPFLLMASFCFAKGSKRFHKWFLNTKLYKKHLESFVRTKYMTLKTKISILIPATLVMLVTMYFARIWHLRVFIGLLILFKYYYFIFRIRTAKKEVV